MEKTTKKMVEILKEKSPKQLIAAARKAEKNEMMTRMTKDIDLEEIILFSKNFQCDEILPSQLLTAKLKEVCMEFFAQGYQSTHIIAYFRLHDYDLCDSCIYNYETEFKEGALAEV